MADMDHTMSAGLKERSNEETPRRSIIGRGRFTFTKGNWYCEYDRAILYNALQLRKMVLTTIGGVYFLSSVFSPSSN
jgi:hypothetical protein